MIKIYRFFEKNKERKKIYIVVLFNQKYTGKYKQKSESISSLSFFSFPFFSFLLYKDIAIKHEEEKSLEVLAASVNPAR